MIGLTGCALAAGSVLAGVMLSGCRGGKQSAAESGQAMQAERQREAVTPTYGRIEQERRYPAFAVYRKKPVVTAPISGYITETCVQAGERVRKGQVLFCIERIIISSRNDCCWLACIVTPACRLRCSPRCRSRVSP